MKKLFLIIITTLYLGANEWCPVTGLKISENLETSYQAKLKSNDSLRVYASLYALLKDRENYGLKDIKKYDSKSKKYLHIELEKDLHVKKNPMQNIYKRDIILWVKNYLKKDALRI